MNTTTDKGDDVNLRVPDATTSDSDTLVAFLRQLAERGEQPDGDNARTALVHFNGHFGGDPEWLIQQIVDDLDEWGRA